MATTQEQVDAAFAVLKAAGVTVRTVQPNVVAKQTVALASVTAFDLALHTYTTLINNSTATQAQIDAAEVDLRAKEQAMIIANQEFRNAQAAAAGAPAALDAASANYSTTAHNAAYGT